MDNKKVVGIILAYKNAQFLEDLYKSIPEGIFDEVFVANDESGDNIAEVAGRLGIKCFSHDRLGYGGNLKFGLQKGLEMGADYMVEIHGDGQYGTLSIIPGLVKIQTGYDFVMGSRFTNWRQPLEDNMSLVRFAANIGLSFFDRLVLRVPLTEFHSGFRIYSRRMLETISFKNSSNDFLYSFEVIAQAVFWGLKIGEVPVRCFYEREHTSIRLRSSSVYAFQMFWTLFLYILAKLGFKIKLFQK